jgi:outer membrane protein assembly factor BamB
VFSSPAVVGGFVYVGSSNGHVYCLDATNGAVVWTYTTGWFVYSSPAAVGGFVYVGSLDDNVYCLNATDGTLVWKCMTGGWVWSSPAVVNGVVYVGSYDSGIYAFGSSSANHDVSIERVITSKSVVGSGYSMGINVTAADVGDFTETLNVTAYANATIIGSENVTLPAGNSTTVTFTWDTTGFAYGNYTISVYAPPVPGETKTANDSLTSDVVTVTIPGDVDGNYMVNQGDVLAILKAFGSTIGMPNYVANCDIDGNGRINMEDLVIVLTHFGQHYP